MANDVWEPLGRLSSIVTVATPMVMLVAYALRKLSDPRTPEMLSGYVRVVTAIALGGIAAAAYGITWSAACALLGWHYGDGGADLPKGLAAVVLSLTATLPLVLVPPLFQYFFLSRSLVPPLHFRASLCMMGTAAIGHVVLYGTQTPRILGFRDRILPIDAPLDFWRAVQMEAVYAIVLFGSTVFVYHLAAENRTGPTPAVWSATKKASLGGMIFFLGACVYIVSRYPASLVAVPIRLEDGTIFLDNRWVTARGVINGAIMMMAFMIALLL